MIKNFKTLIISVFFMLGISTLNVNAAAYKCGKVVMADMNWASASLMANVDKIILCCH